jgi:3-dehydroquinate synthase
VAVISDPTSPPPATSRAWRRRGANSASSPLVLEVPPGEDSKSVAVWADVLERLAAASLDRDAWVCAVGGGVVGDLAGFVAATFLRGVPFVQVPTTLLAMVDASVGGKTGLDLARRQEPGRRVLATAGGRRRRRALATLPPAVVREGAVELYKHALLVDAPWRSAFRACRRTGSVSPLTSIATTGRASSPTGVRVKADVVAADPLERGVRAHLNLGHTLAHALETATGHALAHGTAVAYGLAFAAVAGLRSRLGRLARGRHGARPLGSRRRPAGRRLAR